MMTLTKIDKHYVTDLVWYIVRKYPNIRHSVPYEISKESFIDCTMSCDKGEQLSYIEAIVKKSIMIDNIAKKKGDDKTRFKAAAQCLACLDLI